MRPKNEPFPLGPCYEAGVTVLRASLGAHTRDSLYYVRYECCGWEGSLSHHAMTTRAREGTLRCLHCYKSKEPSQRLFERPWPAYDQVQESPASAGPVLSFHVSPADLWSPPARLERDLWGHPQVQA